MEQQWTVGGKMLTPAGTLEIENEHGVAIAYAQPEFAPLIVQAVNAYDPLLEALGEITEGLGPYNEDRMKHAENTINSMKAIARVAIAKAKGEA